MDTNSEMNEADINRGWVERTENDIKVMDALGLPCQATWGFNFFDLTINRDVCEVCHEVWEKHPCPKCAVNLRTRWDGVCEQCKKLQTA